MKDDKIPGLENLIDEEKVRKLKPIIEQILTRKYGRQIIFKNLTIGNVYVDFTKNENDERT